jgi:antitoxin CptB
MTGTILTSAELDPRRRRVLFRAWHRGTREMDLLLGAFADARLAAMSEAELDAFEALMETPDDLLYGVISGRLSPDVAEDVAMMEDVMAFHRAGLGLAAVER